MRQATTDREHPEPAILSSERRGRGESNLVAPGALEAIVRGEVDSQVATAKQYPRSIKRFREEALTLATLDQETAASCFYRLPPRKGRDGKVTVIEGPSVRLSEIAASCWGNLRCDARVIDEGAEFVTAQATAWDMERNLLVRIETRRRITTKDGKRYGEDMRAMTGNAAVSLAFRNAVQRVIPNAFIVSIYRQARQVAVGDARTLVDRRSKAIEAFGKLGVSQERVLAMLSKPSLEDVDLGDVETLLGVFTAIQEGTASVDEVFAPDPKSGPVRTDDLVEPRPSKAKAEEESDGDGPGSGKTEKPRKAAGKGKAEPEPEPEANEGSSATNPFAGFGEEQPEG